MTGLIGVFIVFFVVDIIVNVHTSRKLKKQKLDDKSLKGDK